MSCPAELSGIIPDRWKMDCLTEKEPGTAPKAAGMMGPGPRANLTGREYSPGRMEEYMKAAGKTVTSTTPESLLTLTVKRLKAPGKRGAS